MKKSDYFFILKSLFIWVICLFIVIFLSSKVFPLQKNFLGGGLGNYLNNPYLWAWSNFDGEHYIAVAKEGYKPLTYFFFPFYPILINIVSHIFGGGILKYLLSGILISWVSLVIAFIGLYKLVLIDYKPIVARLSILILLLFPTSFYFGGVYTESLFLALAIWSFYFARNKKWLLAGIIAAAASATRIVGLAVVAGIMFEALRERKISNILQAGVGFLGIAIYMYYLWSKTGDPLNFLHTVSIFGAQRSGNFVILPQVFYRYIFKVLPNLNYGVFISFYTPILELLTAILFLILTVWSFIKMRVSYAIYLLLGYIIPPLSGSFSSFPRYVLILFPAYILLAQLSTKSRLKFVAFGVVSAILLTVSFTLFVRGYFVS